MRVLQLAILSVMDEHPGVAFTLALLRRHVGNNDRLIRSALTALEVSGHVRRGHKTGWLHRTPTYLRVTS
jgi:hypothetical protein